ncbi:MAG: hypothetical protein ACOCV1_03370 [Bacillota bacterium]
MSKNKVDDKANNIKGALDALEDNDEELKEGKNKNSKEEKMKRSFTLTSNQVKKIYLLKAENEGMTLSEIVGQAIDEFYKSKSEN